MIFVDRFIAWQHTAEREETRLHDRVDAIAELLFFRNAVGIDCIDLDLFVDDRFLNRPRQVLPNFCRMDY